MYTVVSASGKDVQKLIDEVNKHLKDGWKCVGGIYVIPMGIGALMGYYQAMVKE